MKKEAEENKKKINEQRLKGNGHEVLSKDSKGKQRKIGKQNGPS